MPIILYCRIVVNNIIRLTLPVKSFDVPLTFAHREHMMKDNEIEICKRIKEIRKSMKLTQSQFAELCNLSEDSIGKIERCVTIPTIDTLYKISGNLQKPMSSFFSSGNKDKSCAGLSGELTALVTYLKTRPTDDVEFIHELAIKILERD